MAAADEDDGPLRDIGGQLVQAWAGTAREMARLHALWLAHGDLKVRAHAQARGAGVGVGCWRGGAGGR